MQCSFKGKENLQDKTRSEYLVGIQIQNRVQKNSKKWMVCLNAWKTRAFTDKALEFKHY